MSRKLLVRRVAVLGADLSGQLLNRQQPHLERGQGVVNRDLHVGRQRERDVASGMSEVDIECPFAIHPVDAEHVGHRDERVRADQHTAGPKKAVARELPDDAVMLRERRSAAERQRCLGIGRELLRGLRRLESRDQRVDTFIRRADVGAALSASQRIAVPEVDVRMSLDDPALKRSRKAFFAPSSMPRDCSQTGIAGYRARNNSASCCR